MSTPLGDFLRARRDAIRPESVGLPPGARRRVPGLRRSELATLAGISVDYLVRIEQGRDSNPSASIVNALANALQLDATERWHLRQLSKLSSATCVGPVSEPRLEVRPTVRALLDQIEPGIALVTNRLGDVLAHTSGFDLLARPAGVLDASPPNLTRFVFTDDRARTVFPDWDRVADERALDLWVGPSGERAELLLAELAEVAGDTFTARLRAHEVVPGGTQRWRHPELGELRLDREVLELPAADGQQLVVYLAADGTTAAALSRLRVESPVALRAVN